VVTEINETSAPELSKGGAHRFSAAANKIGHVLVGKIRTTGEAVCCSRRLAITEQETGEPVRHGEEDVILNTLLRLPKLMIDIPDERRREALASAQVPDEVRLCNSTDQRIF